MYTRSNSEDTLSSATAEVREVPYERPLILHEKVSHPRHDGGADVKSAPLPYSRRSFFKVLGFGSLGSFLTWRWPSFFTSWWFKPLPWADRPFLGSVSYRFRYTVVYPSDFRKHPERYMRIISKTEAVS